MTRHTASIRRRPTAKPKGFFWRGVLLLVLGFTGGMGAAAYFAAYINKLPLPLHVPPTRNGDKPGEDSLQRTRRESLEFHELLRQRRAIPADQEEAAAPAAPPRRFVYYLQLGAFGRRDAAEQLRGEVALSGEQASIKTGKSATGAAVFRVWMGPYAAQPEAEETRAKLALQGYSQVQLLKLAEKKELP